MTKIKPSKVVTISEQKRFLPIGMDTGKKKDIAEIVSKIDTLIKSAPDFENQDADGFFEMDIDRAMQILELISKTYRFNETNESHKGDMKEVESILYYCASMSGGKVWAMQRTDRNMSRIRSNGAWSDAPDDGHTDVSPSRAKATDRPVLMLLRQNGDRKQFQCGNKADGTPDYINIGWNNTPFYWPVVMTQASIDKMLFAANQKAKETVNAVDISHLTEGLNHEEILQLTYSGDVSRFGQVGDEYSVEDAPLETRGVRNTTASRFFVQNSDGSYAIRSDVKVDNNVWASVYSFNHGEFPFVLRNYKYLLLKAGRRADPQVILLELHPRDTWMVWYEKEFDNDGNLVDRNDDKYILISATDLLTNQSGDQFELSNDDVCQWVICYRVKKVLKYHAPVGQRVTGSSEDKQD